MTKMIRKPSELGLGSIVVERLNEWAAEMSGRWEVYGPIAGLGPSAVGVDLFNAAGVAVGEGCAATLEEAATDALEQARAKAGGS